VEAFRTENASIPPGGIVILGDSLTERFPMDLLPTSATLTNRGIGGDKIGGWKYVGLLDRLDVSVSQLRPSKIILLIGINDIVFAGTPPEYMEAGYDALFAKLKEAAPGAHITVQTILPLGKSYTKHNATVSRMNQVIRRLAEKHRLRFLDTHSVMADAQGELAPDLTKEGVHLTPAGYERWAEALRPLLK